MANTTCEIIWDRDHGTENEGYYARIEGEGDVVLDATTADEARAEVARMYGDVQITRCDESPATYTITTDACSQEIEAASADEAVREFAADEFPGRDIETAAALVAHIERIGDGAFVRIDRGGENILDSRN